MPNPHPLSSWTKKEVNLFILFILGISFNYLLPILQPDDHKIFVGFIANPLDNLTYLAKMQQGYSGFWGYTFPFSLEIVNPAYMFMFYVLSGHIGRILDIPLLIVFHGLRLLCASFLFYSLRTFFRYVFIQENDRAFPALVVATIGSGMGWLAVPFGRITSDFWVAEAFPFLSSYTNAHFPLGMALMTLIILEFMKEGEVGWKRILRIGVLSVLAAFILPYGWITSMVVITVISIIEFILNKTKFPWQGLFVSLVSGGIPAALMYLQAATDPFIKIWNSQNVNLSPGIYDLLISFFPGFLFLAAGRRGASLIRNNKWIRLILVWMLCGLCIAYIPMTFQRRLLTGLFIPTAGLAAIGIIHIGYTGFGVRRLFLVGIIPFLCITNLILLIGGAKAVINQDSMLFLTYNEKAALEWIQYSIKQKDIILASPALGSFIPGITGNRVVYGHPYETLLAEKRLQEVENIFSGEVDPSYFYEYVNNNGIQWIIFGPRERTIGTTDLFTRLPVVYSNDDVFIFSAK